MPSSLPLASLRRALHSVLSAPTLALLTLAACTGADPVPDFTWPLGRPDAVVTLPEPITIAPHERDLFRNLVLPSGISETRYVQTVDFRPGEVGVVHHAVLQIDPTGDSRERDAADPDVGFGGMDMGVSEPPEGHFIGWTPGKTASPGVPERSWLLRGGSDFVVQVHLPATDSTVEVNPAIALYFSDDPPSELLARVLLANESIDIPPGATDYVITDAIDLPVPVEVLAAYPHAHYLGRRMDITATTPDEIVTPLLTIDDWDFGNQIEYHFDEPHRLPAGTRVTMQYQYDNSADNPMNPNVPPRRVRFGLESTDEMATLMLQVRLASMADLHRLTEAQARHTLSNTPRSVAASYDLGTSLLHQGRPAEAIPWFRSTVEEQPLDADAWNNLGVALAQTGQLGEAVSAWQNAVRLEQDNVDAHTNIGRALMAIDEPTEALGHFDKAAALQPDNPVLLSLLARARAATGDRDGAIEAMSRAVDLAPNDSGLRQSLQNLRTQAGQ